MWIIEEGREGFREDGFVRIFNTPTGIQLYGDCEGIDEYGYREYSRKIVFNSHKLCSDVVENKELIKHIKRIAV
jgi:hypothetical protein